MKKTNLKKSLLGVVLTAAMALCMMGCGSTTTTEVTTAAPETTAAETTVAETTAAETTAAETTAAETTAAETTVAETTAVESAAAESEEAKSESAADPIAVGEGATTFTFIVVDADENETTYSISTDETTLGAALLKLEIVAGDMGDYGLYVTTVNGITLDWNKDAMYWALYIDGEYAMTSVDQTELVAGTVYMMKAES